MPRSLQISSPMHTLKSIPITAWRHPMAFAQGFRALAFYGVVATVEDSLRLFEIVKLVCWSSNFVSYTKRGDPSNLQPGPCHSQSASWETRTTSAVIQPTRGTTPAGWSQPPWTGSSSSQFFLARSVPRIGFSGAGHRCWQFEAGLRYFIFVHCVRLYLMMSVTRLYVPYKCLTYQTSFHALPCFTSNFNFCNTKPYKTIPCWCSILASTVGAGPPDPWCQQQPLCIQSIAPQDRSGGGWTQTIERFGTNLEMSSDDTWH